MRTVLFTSDEPFYLPLWLERVLAANADAVEAAVVVPFGDRRSMAREALAAYGPVGGARLGARFGYHRLLGALGAGRLTGRYRTVPGVARAFDVPVRRAVDPDAAALVDRVRDLDPDLVLSVVCGQKLGPDLLAVPDHAVNLHGSLLPKYRGRATGFWPLYHGDDRSGVTAHRMTDRLDDGEILLQRSFPLDPDDTMLSVYRKVAATGAAVTNELLDRLPDVDGRPPVRDDPDHEYRYRSTPTPAERREFQRRDGRFC